LILFDAKVDFVKIVFLLKVLRQKIEGFFLFENDDVEQRVEIRK
jgi:hypothetical protein